MSRKDTLLREEDRAHSAPESRSVSFDVDVGDENRTKSAKKPLKLGSQHALGKRQKSTLVDYTDDETMLIAEIMRDAHIEERKNKARVDVKLHDAQRRRMCTNFMKEQNATKKTEITRSVPDISERRRRVKEMAVAARKQASIDCQPQQTTSTVQS